MNENMSERLSAFLDGEDNDASFIDSLSHNQEARDTWARYQLISDVLSNRYMKDIHKVSAGVSSALANEATLIAPRQWFTKKNIIKQAVGLGMAATVAAVAVMVVSDIPETAVTPEKIAIAPITTQPVNLTTEIEKKLNGYLVSHNEFSASTRMKGMLPYTRIVSHTPGQLVSQQAGADN